MRLRKSRPCWPTAAFLAASVAFILVPVRGAQALDFSSLDVFGWFTSADRPPEPSAATLPYELSIKLSGAGDTSEFRRALQDASLLYRLRQDAPPDGDTLVRRAVADLSPLMDAAWGLGYYNALVSLEVDGVPLVIGRDPPANLAAKVDARRGRSRVPLVIRVDTGPEFALRSAAVTLRQRTDLEGVSIPARIVGLPAGSPARAGEVRAAQARIVDFLRDHSRPLAKVVAVQPTVDHRAGTMDVVFAVDAGPFAGIGPIDVKTPDDIPEPVIRSFIYTEPGDPYSPKAVADMRKSIGRIQAVGSVRIREADALDSLGNLPLFVEIGERPKNLVGASARYSTIDGPALRTYYERRNVFGGAERLRLTGDVFFTPRIDGTKVERFKDFRRSDIGGRTALSFEKPALWGSRNDFLFDAEAVRERVGDDRYGGYTARYADTTAAIRHRFSDTFSVSGGLEFERGQTSDVLGQVDYALLGLPLTAKYDSTDDAFNPTRGWRVLAALTPYYGLRRSTGSFVQAKLATSTYYAFDEEGRYVLAGRIGLGSDSGSSLADIPSTHRFYAGGGGSVRGYAYRALSPLSANQQLVGGRSLVEASVEARIKVTDTIGIVPFIDAGGAFRESYPDFKDPLRYAAGLGLRYYTAIGPIRVDVATPLNPRPGDKPFALYVGIGQAF